MGQGQTLIEPREGGQGEDAGLGIVRVHIHQPLGGNNAEELRPLNLPRGAVGQAQGHDLGDGDAVRGGPGREALVEEEEFGGAAAQRPFVHLFDPGVDAIGVGRQRGLGFVRLMLHRLAGVAIEVEGAEAFVDRQGRGTEKF